MDKELEVMIVKSFFTSRIRDRVIHELSSSKKRSNALDRLCHNYEVTLSKEKLIEIPKPNSCYSDIVNLLGKFGAEDYCYAISFNEDIDGKHLPLKYALEHAVGYGMPSLISCIPKKLAYFESEQGFGPPKRFILKNDNR
ncbi:hypothetical protein [Kroppenstedtia eburnea]|uniref:hypothetical protein n=1 Tax=Kroppenstedtia eburnea TaxID=714067 RepID=UPI000970EC34|nr:hypothetical protein [Kroppenstedtia eburnea]QKI83358.1 hypothetical protein GXN75_15975 [Kroppenstedtia eburnea]